MNCPTRDPEPTGRLGYNQSPRRFDNDTTTNKSLKKDHENGKKNGGKNSNNSDDVMGGAGGGGGITPIIITGDETHLVGNGGTINSVSGIDPESESLESKNKSFTPNQSIDNSTHSNAIIMTIPIDITTAPTTTTSTTTSPVNHSISTPPIHSTSASPAAYPTANSHSRPDNPESPSLNNLKKELNPNHNRFPHSSPDLNVISSFRPSIIPANCPQNIDQGENFEQEISSFPTKGIVKKVRFNTTPPEEFGHSFNSEEHEEDVDVDVDVDCRKNNYTANIPLLTQIDYLKSLKSEAFGKGNDRSDNISNCTITPSDSNMTPPTTSSDATLSIIPSRRRKSSFIRPNSTYGTSSEDNNNPFESDLPLPSSPPSDSESDNMIDHSQELPIPTGRLSISPNSSVLGSSSMSIKEKIDYIITHSRKVAFKYARFIGPGIMVSVAYLDPGNYSTAVTAGAMYQYKHLFVILLSNIFAVFLQILCVKLGSVTGLDLAQNCREHLPRWLCIIIYILAEIAIIATDLAEVVGTAIALNILVGIPLPLGVVLTVLDVLIVLMAYRPNGPVKFVRYFEYMVSGLVFVVVVCFAVELMNIGPIGVGTVLKGFLPSYELVESQGLYMSCGILGATVMPHSLYLGSGLVQPRLREFDTKHGYFSEDSDINSNTDIDNDVLQNSSSSTYSSSSESTRYRPSVHAIKYAMNFSIAELVMSLFTVAIFVNSAILIVAAATLSHSPEALDADLFSIYDMLWKYLGHFAAVIFALALLFSGQSAGIVCTLAGQMVSEGFLHWSFQPWIRRLITRAIAIAPCLFVAVFVGRKGLADVLNASQVVLSLLLPFVSAPLLYFTRSKKIMSVQVTDSSASLNNGYSLVETDESNVGHSSPSVAYIDMSNSKLTNAIAVFIFAFVSSLNVFLIISMAVGADVKL